MWTPEHRRAANRSGLRYPSDLTDAEWAIVEPLIPPAKHGGRKRSIDVSCRAPRCADGITTLTRSLGVPPTLGFPQHVDWAGTGKKGYARGYRWPQGSPGECSCQQMGRFHAAGDVA
jgi:hypothetical protein